MKTNLEYIDNAVNGFVDTIDPANLPASVHKECMTNVAGFPVLSHDLLKAKQKEVESRQSGYVHDRMAMKEEFAKVGIKAKAFIPLRIWERICEENNLYRMSPRVGMVGITANADKITSFMTSWTVMTVLAVEVMTLAYVAVFVFAPVQSIGPTIGLTFVTAAITAGLTALVFALAFNGFDKETGRLQIWLYTKFASHARIMKHFMPNGVEYTGLNRIDVGLVLPPAPASVAATLSKLTNWHRPLKVAAVAEAINFNVSFRDIFNKDHDKRVQERAIERARLAALRDPIIYDVRNSCVAIIEQFGDFPVEQAVVDDLLTREFLL